MPHTKQTGLIPSAPGPVDWIMGAETGVQKVIRMPDGIWTPLKPTFEKQYKQYAFDTMSCASFSGLSLVEIMLKYLQTNNLLTNNHLDFLRLFNFIDSNGNFNASDNFTAIMSGTTAQGNTFVNVWNSIRNDGLLSEAYLPFTGDTFEQYHDKKKITDYMKRRARKFLSYFTLQYEWVMYSYDQDNDMNEGQMLVEGLKESPLHIGVPIPASHAMVLLAVKNGDFKVFFDTYEPAVEQVAWGTRPIHSAIKGILLPKTEVPKFPEYEFKNQLMKGMSGPDVTALQKILNYFGHMNVVTGYFGPVTEGALREFQKFNKIDPVGVVGPVTRAFLNSLRSSPKSPAILLYQAALECLGTDVTPGDEVPDDVACAVSVNAVRLKAHGKAVGGGASTNLMYQALKAHTEFKEVFEPKPGDIIISPTGYGNGKVSNGHVGIMGEAGKIMSNSSPTGLWTQNFSLTSWYARYRDKGGYPVKFYRAL